ncbi:MAG: hypothetical protein LBE07_06640, partial [Gordonia sp. (in: high G+C Gram-positive bacteria)]|nr:hypothetical protein [Gordonia sp. (in: high G+C Gram-positive bacteria)]
LASSLKEQWGTSRDVQGEPRATCRADHGGESQLDSSSAHRSATGGRHRVGGEGPSQLVRRYEGWRLEHPWWDRILPMVVFIAILSGLGHLLAMVF